MNRALRLLCLVEKNTPFMKAWSVKTVCCVCLEFNEGVRNLEATPDVINGHRGHSSSKILLFGMKLQ